MNKLGVFILITAIIGFAIFLIQIYGASVN